MVDEIENKIEACLEKTMRRFPWIGVDFDGTLVEDGTGRPIMKMVERVRQWLAEGKNVRIFTARVAFPQMDLSEVRQFCEYHFGQVLPITNQKDYDMIELWDDRAVQVIKNTGERADGKA
jgi:hypothetical protein